MNVVLRPAAAILLVAGVLTTQAAALTGRAAGWVGDPLWGQEVVGVAQVLALPLVAGLGAWSGWMSSDGVLSLFWDRRTRLRHLATAALTLAGVAAIPYLVSNAAVILVSHRQPLHPDNWSLWPVVTQVLAAAFALVVGMVIGCFVRSWTAVVLAGVLLATLVLLDRLGTLPLAVQEFTANGTMFGAVPNAQYFSLRLIWLTACVLALVGLPVYRRPGRAVALGCTGVVLIAGGHVFAANSSYRFTPLGQVVCHGSAPQVCAPPQFSLRAQQAQQVAHAAAAEVNRLGAPTPARLVMWTPNDRGVDFVELYDPGKFRAPLDTAAAVSAMVAPKSCAVWRSSTPPPAQWFAAAAIVEDYAATHGHGTAGGPLAQFRHSWPAAQQSQALTEMARALQRCRPQLVPDGLGDP